MPRPRTNLHRKIREILEHVAPLLPESGCPILHFERSANVALSAIKYVDDHIDPNETSVTVYARHRSHLRRMTLAELIESFERFLKELAAVCVDFLAPLSIDNRFDEFIPKRGEQISAFVTASSIGKALCESDTWLKNSTISRRFKTLLKMPFGDDWELLFPERNQSPASERDRAATLELLWQVRHNLAHNLGVVTHSDAMKFRAILGGPISADCRISPTSLDLQYVKRFLFESANQTNRRISARLAEILSRFHELDPTLFDAQKIADSVSVHFNHSVTIHGCSGVL